MLMVPYRLTETAEGIAARAVKPLLRGQLVWRRNGAMVLRLPGDAFDSGHPEVRATL